MTASLLDPTKKLPRVALVTDVNDLVMPLAIRLKENSCRVDIISNDQNYWHQKTVSQNTKYILARKITSEEPEINYSYIIFVNLFQKKDKKIQKKLNYVINLANRLKARIVFVLPFVYGSKDEKIFSSICRKVFSEKDLNVIVLFIGQLIGPEMDLSRKDDIAQTINKAITQDKIGTSDTKHNLYPVSIKLVVEEVLKKIFSFTVERQFAIVSEEIDLAIFNSLIKEIKPNISFVKSKIISKTKTAVARKIIIRQDLKKQLELTFDEFSHLKPKPVKKKKKNKPNIKIKIKKTRLSKAIIAAALVVLFPVASWLICIASIYLGVNSLANNNLKAAKSAFLLSKTTAEVSSEYLSLAEGLPGVSGVASSQLKLTNIIVQTSKIGLREVKLAGTVNELLANVVSNEPYNTRFYARTISLELDYLYKDLGFLISEVDSQQNVTRNFLTKLLNTKNISKKRSRLLLYKQIAEELPKLLGEEDVKKYLVILQDNREIWPTGGRIKSFAILSFNDGRLISGDVQSVKEADSQLRGYISPPKVLSKYFNQDNWYFKDSNWDYDFPSSAARAEWFLDKEMNMEVDGVIAIDFEFVRNIFGLTGLDSRDYYSELIGSKSEELVNEIFSGVIADFRKELINEENTVNTAIFDSLEERHFQIFFHNNKTQRAVYDLGWSGAITPLYCSGNCMSDWLAIIEANLAGNYSSNFVNKRRELSVSFEEGVVKRNLLLYIENPTTEDDTNYYKSYIRLITPLESGFSPVSIFDQEETKSIIPDTTIVQGYKETGVYIELGPGESKTLQFSWESSTNLDYNEPGEYQFYLRKQAGTLDEPIAIKLRYPKYMVFKDTGVFSLTNGKILDYNTELSRDFFSRIYW